jgi:hypothetical protein
MAKSITDINIEHICCPHMNTDETGEPVRYRGDEITLHDDKNKLVWLHLCKPCQDIIVGVVLSELATQALKSVLGGSGLEKFAGELKATINRNGSFGL